MSLIDGHSLGRGSTHNQFLRVEGGGSTYDPFIYGLSRVQDGLLVVEVDLNACRQVRDHWGFQMTQRLDLYAKSLTQHAQKLGYDV